MRVLRRGGMSQEMQTDPSKHGNLGFITGVVSRSKFVTFERILFRATRGNMFLKSAAIEQPIIDPATGDKVTFSVTIDEFDDVV
jgi:V-type H+-transporting ATPase subunit a